MAVEDSLPPEAALSSHPPTAVDGRKSTTFRLGLAGIMAVGVSFGFARYGYCLFLPEIRAEFGLSVTVVGLISSATYVGYLGALTLVGALVTRVGPRALITVGGLSATAGMVLVAVASRPAVLAVGLILAATSPGWIWAPYSDAAKRLVAPEGRDRILARIPSGTAFGVAIAGPLALLTHASSWRYAWLVFAGGALLATVYNVRVLPPGPGIVDERRSLGHHRIRGFARRAATPMYVSAFSYGLTGSVYWLLAVEAISSTTGPGSRTAAMFWTLMGVAGTVAAFTGAAFARFGLRLSHTLVFAGMSVAIGLLGIAPVTATAVVSALIYGPTFMAGSALLAVWSYRVFEDRPTTGFSATVFCLGIGTIAGPALAGPLADQHGLGFTFVLAATMSMATCVLRPAFAGGRQE